MIDLKKEDLEKIVNDDYSWIKVKKYDGWIENLDDYKIGENDLYDEYLNLSKHHKEETDFLISVCRELAGRILEAIESCKDILETLNKLKSM